MLRGLVQGITPEAEIEQITLLSDKNQVIVEVIPYLKDIPTENSPFGEWSSTNDISEFLILNAYLFYGEVGGVQLDKEAIQSQADQVRREEITERVIKRTVPIEINQFVEGEKYILQPINFRFNELLAENILIVLEVEIDFERLFESRNIDFVPNLNLESEFAYYYELVLYGGNVLSTLPPEDSRLDGTTPDPELTIVQDLRTVSAFKEYKKTLKELEEDLLFNKIKQDLPINKNRARNNFSSKIFTTQDFQDRLRFMFYFNKRNAIETISSVPSIHRRNQQIASRAYEKTQIKSIKISQCDNVLITFPNNDIDNTFLFDYSDPLNIENGSSQDGFKFYFGSIPLNKVQNCDDLVAEITLEDGAIKLLEEIYNEYQKQLRSLSLYKDIVSSSRDVRDINAAVATLYGSEEEYPWNTIPLSFGDILKIFFDFLPIDNIRLEPEAQDAWRFLQRQITYDVIESNIQDLLIPSRNLDASAVEFLFDLFSSFESSLETIVNQLNINIENEFKISPGLISSSKEEATTISFRITSDVLVKKDVGTSYIKSDKRFSDFGLRLFRSADYDQEVLEQMKDIFTIEEFSELQESPVDIITYHKAYLTPQEIQFNNLKFNIKDRNIAWQAIIYADIVLSEIIFKNKIANIESFSKLELESLIPGIQIAIAQVIYKLKLVLEFYNLKVITDEHIREIREEILEYQIEGDTTVDENVLEQIQDFALTKHLFSILEFYIDSAYTNNVKNRSIKLFDIESFEHSIVFDRSVISNYNKYPTTIKSLFVEYQLPSLTKFNWGAIDTDVFKESINFPMFYYNFTLSGRVEYLNSFENGQIMLPQWKRLNIAEIDTENTPVVLCRIVQDNSFSKFFFSNLDLPKEIYNKYFLLNTRGIGVQGLNQEQIDDVLRGGNQRLGSEQEETTSRATDLVERSRGLTRDDFI